MEIKITSRQQNREFTGYILENIEFDLAEVLDYIRDNFAPDDVFSKIALQDWAEDNGYTLE